MEIESVPLGLCIDKSEKGILRLSYLFATLWPLETFPSSFPALSELAVRSGLMFWLDILNFAILGALFTLMSILSSLFCTLRIWTLLRLLGF